MKLCSSILVYIIVLLSIALQATPTMAETLDSPFSVDQKVWLVGRSYPVGGQAFYTLGANYMAWDGSSDSPKDMWKYGYFRAALNAATSAVVNRAGIEFQFFPISLLGISAGYDWGFRNFKPKFVDCSLYDCTGRVDRAYLRAQLFAGYSKLVFVGNFRFEELKHVGGGRFFFDEMTLLPCNSEKENILLLNPTLLYSIDEKYRIGATSVLARAVTSGGVSHLFGPLVQYAFDKRSYAALGMGRNHSDLAHPAFTIFLMLSYTIAPSLSIGK